MAQYLDSEGKTVEANQFKKIGDCGLNNLFTSDYDEKQCSLCGMSMKFHSEIIIDGGTKVVCPGDWIVDDGVAKFTVKPDVFIAEYIPK